MLNIPNLPDNKITLCAVKNIPEIITALHELDIETLSPVPDCNLDDEVNEHSDMLLCHTGNKKIILAPSQQNLYNELKSRGFDVSFSENLQKKYPEDILLNVAVSKDFACGNFKFTSKTLLENLTNKKLICVKQGYAKCSICFVAENAYITEDAGIKEALKNTGSDVLFIEKGDIFLSEKHIGFFGGATGKISKNELAVCGSLSTHRNCNEIKEFLKKHNVTPVELFDGQIKDIGGILPLI